MIHGCCYYEPFSSPGWGLLISAGDRVQRWLAAWLGDSLVFKLLALVDLLPVALPPAGWLV